ncbi:MAG: hypothetical protein ACYC5G_01250 [Candidatus Doudnabacteria bacterium]
MLDDEILGDDDGSGFFIDEPIVPEVKPIETEVKTDEIKTDVEVKPIETDKPEPTATNWLEEANKSFGTDFKTEEDFKSILDSYTSLKEKTSKIDQYESLKGSFDRVVEEYKKLDPKNLFTNEVEYKANILRKENPSINGEVASKVFTIDVEKEDPLNIIALDQMINHKSIRSGEAAKTYFLKQNGIDVDDIADLDEYQKMTIDVAAEKATKNILALRNQVSIPNFQATVDEILSNASIAKVDEPTFDASVWDGKLGAITSSIDKIEIKDGDKVIYSEAVDAEFKEGFEEVLKEAIVINRLSPTPENESTLRKNALDVYFNENRDSIIKRAIKATELRLTEEFHNKTHADVDLDKVVDGQKPKPQGRTTDLMKEWGYK